jgi:hypothetical protein
MTTSARSRRRPELGIVAAYLRDLRAKARSSTPTTTGRRSGTSDYGGMAPPLRRRAQAPRG